MFNAEGYHYDICSIGTGVESKLNLITSFNPDQIQCQPS